MIQSREKFSYFIAVTRTYIIKDVVITLIKELRGK